MTSREIDIKIAEVIYGSTVTFLNQKSGWRVDYISDNGHCNEDITTSFGRDGQRLRYYSSDVKSAWDLVEFLKNKDIYFNITPELIDGVFKGHCVLGYKFNSYSIPRYVFSDKNIFSENISKAICLAALDIYGHVYG